MDKNENSTKQRDRPGFRDRLALWFKQWGADTLFAAGAVCASAGAALIYLPAGLILGGALLIVGGVLVAKGGGGP